MDCCLEGHLYTTEDNHEACCENPVDANGQCCPSGNSLIVDGQPMCCIPIRKNSYSLDDDGECCLPDRVFDNNGEPDCCPLVDEDGNPMDLVNIGGGNDGDAPTPGTPMINRFCCRAEQEPYIDAEGKTRCCKKGGVYTNSAGNPDCCEGDTYTDDAGNKQCCAGGFYTNAKGQRECCEGQKATSAKTFKEVCCTDGEVFDNIGKAKKMCCEPGMYTVPVKGENVAENSKWCCDKEGEALAFGMDGMTSVSCCSGEYVEEFRIKTDTSTGTQMLEKQALKQDNCCPAETHEPVSVQGASEDMKKCCPKGSQGYMKPDSTKELQDGNRVALRLETECCSNTEDTVMHVVEVANVSGAFYCCPEGKSIAYESLSTLCCESSDRLFDNNQQCCPLHMNLADVVKPDGTTVKWCCESDMKPRWDETTNTPSCCPEGEAMGDADLGKIGRYICCPEDEEAGYAFSAEENAGADEMTCCKEEKIVFKDAKRFCCSKEQFAVALSDSSDNVKTCCNAQDDKVYRNDEGALDCCRPGMIYARFVNNESSQTCCKGENKDLAAVWGPVDTGTPMKIDEETVYECCDKEAVAVWLSDKGTATCCPSQKQVYKKNGEFRCCSGEVFTYNDEEECCEQGKRRVPVEGYGEWCCEPGQKAFVTEGRPSCCYPIENCAVQNADCSCSQCDDGYTVDGATCSPVNHDCPSGQEWTAKCGCHQMCDSCMELNQDCECASIPNRGRGIGLVTDDTECACDNYFLYTDGSGGCVPKDLNCNGSDTTYCHKNKGGIQCCNKAECGQNNTVCYNP